MSLWHFFFSSRKKPATRHKLILIGPLLCSRSADWLMQMEPYRAKLEFNFVDTSFFVVSIKSSSMNTN